MSALTSGAWEPEFIDLWTQGLETATIAQRLRISRGMLQSQAHRLQQRGLIQPRPKGGAYPSLRAKARQDGSPRTSAETSAVDRHRCSVWIRHWSGAAARSARRRGAGIPPARPIHGRSPRPPTSADTGADHCTATVSPRQSRALESVDLGCHSGRDRHAGGGAGMLPEPASAGVPVASAERAPPLGYISRKPSPAVCRKMPRENC
jgi:hypothetical protein